MNKLSIAMNKKSKETLTTNGAIAYSSTLDSLVDYFGCAGSLRETPESVIISKVDKMYKEDALLATKAVFYTRNIRGGLGERQTFRTIIRHLADTRTDILKKNLHLIPHYGRWDDLFVLFDTKLEQEMMFFVKEQIADDLENFYQQESVSLLAKWLPSANASSRTTKRLGKKFAEYLGKEFFHIKPFNQNTAEKRYRHLLTSLRRYLDIVEIKMSNGEWHKIAYEGVSSNAMTKYREAFYRNDFDRYSQYIQDVLNGDTKINSNTLYPYNILEAGGLNTHMWSDNFILPEWSDALEAQWRAFPNYVEEPANFLVMADTSGSMWGRPMATSIGLAVYFAERNQGAFHNQFMTFSREPQFVTIEGETLPEKLSSFEAIHSSTNLAKALRELASVAEENSVPQSEMPEALIIISDMEIDYMFSGQGAEKKMSNLIFRAKEDFHNKGYEMPKIVFWNVESSERVTYLATSEDNVQFISGSSTSSFEALIRGASLSAKELVLETLNHPQYNLIIV